MVLCFIFKRTPALSILLIILLSLKLLNTKIEKIKGLSELYYQSFVLQNIKVYYDKLNSILDDSDPENDPLMIAWPVLKIGMSFDLEGKRDKACDYYRKVVGMKNGAGAQFLAKKMLEKGPEKDDPFICY